MGGWDFFRGLIHWDPKIQNFLIQKHSYVDIKVQITLICVPYCFAARWFPRLPSGRCCRPGRKVVPHQPARDPETRTMRAVKADRRGSGSEPSVVSLSTPHFHFLSRLYCRSALSCCPGGGGTEGGRRGYSWVRRQSSTGESHKNEWSRVKYALLDVRYTWFREH